MTKPTRKTQKPIMRPKLEQYLRKSMLGKSEFAKILGVVPSCVTAWLYSNVMPEQYVLRRIATKFGLSANEVYDLFETIEEVE